jgi:hypothetical protein
MTVELDEDRGSSVLQSHACVSSGNVFAGTTVLCSTDAPCSVSFFAKSSGPATAVWQGLSNDFPGAHSWPVTPGGTDQGNPDLSDSYFNSETGLSPNKWTLVQYIYPKPGHSGEHQWNHK